MSRGPLPLALIDAYRQGQWRGGRRISFMVLRVPRITPGSVCGVEEPRQVRVLMYGMCEGIHTAVIVAAATTTTSNFPFQHSPLMNVSIIFVVWRRRGEDLRGRRWYIARSTLIHSHRMCDSWVFFMSGDCSIFLRMQYKKMTCVRTFILKDYSASFCQLGKLVF